MLNQSAQLPRYDAFNVYDFPYKTVQTHSIELSILVPKKLRSGQSPLLVRFHGGGLVEGVRLGDWFRPYILDYCAANSIVIVTPDYRFLPESTGRDILEDIRDVWRWTAQGLERALKEISSGLGVDLQRVAVTGESAGGYLAAQSFAMPGTIPPTIRLRAALLQAPILDLDILRSPAMGSIFDLPSYSKTRPLELVQASGADTIVTSHEPDMGLRFEAAISMFQHGTFVEALHGRLDMSTSQADRLDDSSLWPTRNLDRLSLQIGDSVSVPALWIVTGWQDCMVPPEGAVKFCSAYKRLFKPASVLVDILNGDHGFDGEWASDAPEVKRGWDFVRQHWLD